MHSSMVMFTFSIFDWKYPLWSNLIQKFKIVSLSWNLVPRLIRICRIQWWCSLLYFRSENLFFGKFRPKIQNFLKLNLVPWLIWIWRIQRWCSLFLIFFIINTLLGQFWSKKSNCQFKLKFCSQTYSNMHNWMVMFLF